MVQDARGSAFTMMTAERLVAGLGASHVLETALTLDRNTGLPYLPGSTVKGLARAWGLLEVAAQLNVKLEDTDAEGQPLLNTVAELLIAEPDETLLQTLRRLRPTSDVENAEAYIQWFRLIFGSQINAAAVCFLDAIYYGESAPQYASDVMTPHYVNYYTENGGRPPSEDDNPNPVSFITVDRGNTFAFGLVPRKPAFTGFPSQQQETALSTSSICIQQPGMIAEHTLISTHMLREEYRVELVSFGFSQTICEQSSLNAPGDGFLQHSRSGQQWQVCVPREIVPKSAYTDNFLFDGPEIFEALVISLEQEIRVEAFQQTLPVFQAFPHTLAERITRAIRTNAILPTYSYVVMSRCDGSRVCSPHCRW